MYIPRIKINTPDNHNYRTKPINYENKKGLEDLNKFISLVRKKGAEIVVVQFWDKDEFLAYKPKEGHEIIRKVLTFRGMSIKERKHIGEKGKKWILKNRSYKKLSCSLSEIISKIS